MSHTTLQHIVKLSWQHQALPMTDMASIQMLKSLTGAVEVEELPEGCQ